MDMKGVVLTGLGAYLITSKAIRMLERTVDRVTNASVWKSYYRAYAKSGRTDMSEPFKSNKTEEKEKKSSAASEALTATIADTIKEVCSTLKDKLERKEWPLEGQTEASEKPKSTQKAIELSSEKNMRNLEDGYDKIYIDWYPEEDLYTDSMASDVHFSEEEIEKMIGYSPKWWFENSINPNNENVRYIRNNLINMDIALIRVIDHYSDVNVEEPEDGDGE